jgi:hypothetical protein
MRLSSLRENSDSSSGDSGGGRGLGVATGGGGALYGGGARDGEDVCPPDKLAEPYPGEEYEGGGRKGGTGVAEGDMEYVDIAGEFRGLPVATLEVSASRYLRFNTRCFLPLSLLIVARVLTYSLKLFLASTN